MAALQVQDANADMANWDRERASPMRGQSDVVSDASMGMVQAPALTWRVGVCHPGSSQPASPCHPRMSQDISAGFAHSGYPM